MKILIAADGSTYTKRMLAYLAAHDEWLGDRHAYTVLNVVPAIPARAAAVMDRETLNKQIASVRDGAADLLEQLAGAASQVSKKKPAAAAARVSGLSTRRSRSCTASAAWGRNSRTRLAESSAAFGLPR